jgi:putative ABC transport system substrate-binding protein
MRRRNLVTILGGAAFTAPFAARAQQKGTPVVGYIDGAAKSANEALFDAFRAGMRTLGWIDGVNIEILDRWGNGDDARLPGIIA